MTNYGTIPTSTLPTTSSGSPIDIISRAKERGRSALATRRPWRELVDFGAFSFRPSLGEAYLRIRSNASYFTMNYTIIVLLIVFLSILWHPISMIVFIIMLIAWLVLYFFRDEPLAIFGYTIRDTFVLVGLSIVTLALLLLTNATANILVSLLIGLLVVVIHAALRNPEEQEDLSAGPGRWYTAVPSSL